MTTPRISTANAHRDFFDDYISPIPPTPTPTWDISTNHSAATHHHAADRTQDQLSLLESLHTSTIGQYDVITTPFGEKKLTYADFTASGRALLTLESYLDTEVLPLYANTHTTSNTTGLQTTLYRLEARSVVARACRASLTEDSVIFAGSGATAAVNMAINILHLKDIVEYCKKNQLPLPVILVGPHEHHSNFLPWRETGAKVVVIAEKFHNPVQIRTEHLFTMNDNSTLDVLSDLTPLPTDSMNSTNSHHNDNPSQSVTLDDRLQTSGCLSQSHLHTVLQHITTHYPSPYIITSFSAASNVTGFLEDTLAVTAIVKSYGALSIWDYAACAPTQKIDMNPNNVEYLKKDIIFFSPHKLLGGVNTPGVLVLKNNLLSRTFQPSTNTGGGTVFFVSPQEHTYLNDYNEREEAGTPDIVGSIRCGLVFKLKEQLGTQPALRINAISRTIINILTKHPYIQVLAHDPLFNHQSVKYNDSLGYSGVVSILIHTPQLSSLSTPSQSNSNSILPPQFVSSLLNDLFGIQTRHGCMCAGPYLHSLLGITQSDSTTLLNNLYLKHEDTRPGVTRISFHYSMPLYVVEFITKAILWIATHGWKLLPLYKCVLSSGEWKHHTRRTKEESRRWLNSMSFMPYGIQLESKRITLEQQYQAYLSDTANDNSMSSSIVSPIVSESSQSSTESFPVPLHIQRINVVEAINLATYLLQAQKLTSTLSCSHTIAIPTLAEKTTSTVFGSVSNDTHFFTYNDHELMAKLFEIADIYLEVLKSTHFTTSNATFSSTLPICKQTDRINDNFPPQLTQQLWSNTPSFSSLIDTMNGKVDSTPFIQSLYQHTATPPHANPSFSPWFPTPHEVSSYLQPLLAQPAQKTYKNPQKTHKTPQLTTPTTSTAPTTSTTSTTTPSRPTLTHSSPSPSSISQLSPSSITTFVNSIFPTNLYLWIKSSLFANFTKPTAILLPCCPIHPGTTALSIPPQSRLNTVISSLAQLITPPTTQDTTTCSTNSMSDSTDSPSSCTDSCQPPHYIDLNITKSITFPVPKAITPLKPAWFSLSQVNEGLDLHSLCLNCWHRHAPSTTTTSTSQECVACNCVQFRPATTAQQSTKKPILKPVPNDLQDSSLLPITNAVQGALPFDLNNNGKIESWRKTLDSNNNNKAQSAINSSPSPSTSNGPAATVTTNTTATISSQQAAPQPTHPQHKALASGSLDPNHLNKNQTKKLYTKLLKKTVAEAMIDFDMIRPGDRVLVGVSGGKDSLSLLHALLEIKRMVPIPFEIAAATINPMTEDYDPSPLIEYFKGLGVTYHYESFPIMAKAMELSKGKERFSICSFCSRMRRGMLYSVCRKNGYNVLALGQHLDDFAESFIMSAFHNSNLGTMKPHYTNNNGDLRIIRPLALTREAKTREFANLHALPIISENCPACFSAPQERARVKLMLANQESIHPRLYNCLAQAMKPLMMMGLYKTVDEKAKSLATFLAAKEDHDDAMGDDADASGMTLPDRGVEAQAQPRLKPPQQRLKPPQQQSQAIPNQSSTTSFIELSGEQSISQPVPLLSTVTTSTTEPNPISSLSAEELSNMVMNDVDDSGDEECAECVGVTGENSLSCPIRKKNGKRLRPNPPK